MFHVEHYALRCMMFHVEHRGTAAFQARGLGWPVQVMDGEHLEMLTQPQAVAKAIAGLVSPWYHGAHGDDTAADGR